MVHRSSPPGLTRWSWDARIKSGHDASISHGKKRKKPTAKERELAAVGFAEAAVLGIEQPP